MHGKKLFQLHMDLGLLCKTFSHSNKKFGSSIVCLGNDIQLLPRLLSRIFHLKRRGKAGRAAQHRLLRLEKREWESDSQGRGFIDKERFRMCVFELVDIWCDARSIDEGR